MYPVKAARTDSYSVSAAFVLFVLLAVIASACSRGEVKKATDFELGCRLNGFSWITKEQQEGGIALAGKPCLGCTTDVDNHFCNEKDFAEALAVLSDFRDTCKANAGTWMLMQPTINNAMLSERMCWGCMADDQNHFCSKDDYLRFESIR
ncbi:MAG: hypothetical protein AABX69_05130 [Nanoarchaeota archaeon]